MTSGRSSSYPLAPARTTPLYAALFLAFTALCFLRVALSNRILDLGLNYTADGGMFLEKMHPTLWGFLVIGSLVLVNYRIELSPWEVRVVRAILLVGATATGLLVFGTIAGHGGSTGYLIDTYILLIAVIVFFAFPPEWRRQTGTVLLAYMIASAVLGIFEFALRFRLMPFTEGESVFRPTGFANHPLEFGLWCTIAMCFVAGTRWPPVRRFVICALLFAGCVVSGARMATVACFICAFVLLAAASGEGLAPRLAVRRRLIVILAALLVAPVLIGAMMAAGGLARFGTGADANAMSRIDVYGILSGLSWGDLLFGTDIDAIRKLVKERYDYFSIESSLLVMEIQFGLIGSLVFLATLVKLARAVVSGAGIAIKLAFLSFFVVALTNNTLTAKSSAIFLIVVLGIAFHDETRPAKSGSAF